MADTDTVPLWDPKRSDIVDVPRNVADNLVKTGYHYKTGDDALREETDQGTVGKVAALTHSYINSLGFGLPDLAAAHVPSMLGGDTLRSGLERVHKQEADHSNYSIAGDVAGYFGPGGLLHLAGKGAEKAGLHSLLKAAAEHTPQHLAENLGTSAATKYAFGENATRLAKKAAGAAGFGVEAGVRGATKEDVNQTLYDKKYDVEKVAQAFGYDALVGATTDATFGVAGEGLRGLRKGVSKSADILEKVLPKNVIRTGRSEIEGGTQTKVALKKVQRETTKEKTKTRVGGGYEKGDTHARVKTNESAFEETKAKVENEIDDRFDTQTTTKEKPKPSHTVQYKEDIYDTPTEDANTGAHDAAHGYAWDKDAKPHEIVAAIRTELDGLVEGDKTDFDMSRKVMENEADYKQALAEERHGDAYRLKKDKDEYQTYLTEKYPQYGPLLDEYGKVMRNEHQVFDHAAEAKAAENAKKIGTKVTTEISGQEPEITTREKTKNDNYNQSVDQTTTRAKSSKETLDETKTKFHRDFDKEEKELEHVTHKDTYEPIKYIVPKKEYVNHYKTMYSGFIPWEVKGLATYAGFHTGTHGVVAPLIAGDLAIPHVLSNRSRYARALDVITQKPIKALGTLTRNLTTSAINRKPSEQSELSRMLRNPDKLYQQVTTSLQAHAGDPGATQQAIQGHWQHALADHPQLQTGLIVHTQNVARVAQAHIPPDMRPPTAQHTPYNPPRSQKVKFLRLFHAINQPLSALENPTPQMINVIEQTNPETLNLVRRSLAGHIAENKEPFKGKAAQVVSMILGEPINPRNAPGYLKRLQNTATLDNPTTEPSGGNMQGPHAGSIAGPKSAKVQQDAATLYATPQQLQMLA